MHSTGPVFFQTCSAQIRKKYLKKDRKNRKNCTMIISFRIHGLLKNKGHLGFFEQN